MGVVSSTHNFPRLPLEYPKQILRHRATARV
jgi:hypothetical protein